MQVLEFFTKKKNQQIEAVSFAPVIRISPTSTLHVVCTPEQANTASNITINSYPSKTNLTLLQTKIQWRRFKIASDTQHTNTSLPFVTGNTYQCQPADIGYYIQAKITSLDTFPGFAEVTIGPIKLDHNVKMLIQGALYSRSLRSQVKVLERNQARNVDMILTDRYIKLTDQVTNKQVQVPYNMHQPKIQVNPKDTTKIFLRFQRDQQGKVQQWLDSLFEQTNRSFDEQSKKSFNSHGSSSSSRKIFRNAGSTSKVQVLFLTRHTRDQFIFSLKAFVCKQQVKNSAVMEIVNNVADMKTEADAHKFFEFMSIKLELYRLAQLAKKFQDQLNNKIQDVVEMQQNLLSTTTWCATLLETKARQLNIDLNQSYAENSVRMQRVMGKKQIRQLQLQNEKLKQRVRNLVQQNQLYEFFDRKKNNQSMMLNQTNNNPFQKKQSNDSYYGPSMAYENQMPRQTNNKVAQLTKSYLSLLKQNQKLKQQRKNSIIVNNPNISKDNDLEEILTSIHNQEQPEKIKALEKENKNLKEKIEEMSQSLRKSNVSRSQYGVKLNQSVAYQNQERKIAEESYVGRQDRSYVVGNNDRSAIQRLQKSYGELSQSNLNDSMTSQAMLMSLQNKVRQIGLKNKQILSENTRLRSQRDKYRAQYEKLVKAGGNSSVSPIDHRSVFSSSNFFDPEGLKQQNQMLTNQKNSLLRKIQSLTKQASKGDPLLQRKCEQLTKQNNLLKQQNQRLKQKIQQIRSQKLSNSDSSENYKQNDRLKKINSQLLQERKNLKLQLQRKSNQLYNSRVIQLENQVSYLKKASNNQGTDKATKDLLLQISNLQKDNEKLTQLKKQIEQKAASQAILIENLMNSNSEHSLSITGKDKSYSETRNDSESNEKLKKKIKQLQEQIIMMRRSADAIDRSKDYSMDMLNYNEQQIKIYKKQREMMLQENQNLRKIVTKWSKEAQEARQQLLKYRQQAMQAMVSQDTQL